MNWYCNIGILFVLIITTVYIQDGNALEDENVVDNAYKSNGWTSKSSNDSAVCGPGGQYTTCGSACPVNCDSVPDAYVVCPMVCRPGCICGSGYVLKSIKNPICIKKEKCNKSTRRNKCSENEIYKRCGSACPPTCDDLRNTKRHKICTLQCIRGCFCKQGYYRAKNGTCVKSNQCFKDQNKQYIVLS